MSDKEDGEVLSEGELEDGELPSSDEEDDTAKDEEPLNPPKSPPSLQAESEQHHAAQKRPLPEEEAGAAEKLTPEQKVVSVINLIFCYKSQNYILHLCSHHRLYVHIWWFLCY